MRKFFVAGLLLCAVILACETKTPIGPEGLTPTTSTTSTSTIASTSSSSSSTSSTTTTTVVIASLARRYVAFNPPPNVPSDMTLFFELLTPQAAEAQRAARAARNGRPSILGFGPFVTENEYRVTGVYVMGNGTTGTVTGELGESLNPLETGGEFEGNLTAKTTTGCTAQRDFSGELSPQTLNWEGRRAGTSTCSPSPLAFASFSMLRSDPNAPLPTPPPAPTTTVATTTSVPTCSYSLSPNSATIGATGGTASVVVNTANGCAWTAQSFADFITGVAPASGAGAASISYTVAANTGPQRTGTLIIAGVSFPVMQDAVPPDLVPALQATCTFGPFENRLLNVTINNVGAGTAGSSVTAVALPGASPITALTPAIGPKQSTVVTFDAPSGFCPGPSQFQVTADATSAIVEASETNNTATVTVSAPLSPTIGAVQR
jgi:CARDB